MHSLLNFCRDDWGIIDSAPFLRQLRPKKRAYRFLTSGQERRLLAAAGPALHRFITFILGTGARKSEAVELTWDDVSLSGAGRSWVRFPDTKNGHPNAVPLPNHVADMLKAIRFLRRIHLASPRPRHC